MQKAVCPPYPPYKEASKKAAEALVEVLGCNYKCIKNALDKYHVEDCDIDSNEKLDANLREAKKSLGPEERALLEAKKLKFKAAPIGDIS